MGDVRRIVLTGASRGLGRALTARFVALGHTVHGCATSESAIDELSREYAGPHTFHRVDVSDDSQVQAWAKALLASVGPPDLLLNNAAVISPNAPLWETTPDDFARVVDVNIKGVYHVIRAFAPAMIARRQGVIVNFSSGWGRSTSADVAPYCGSKWAIEGLTSALAQELPSGMAAVALNPGIINTDMLASCFGESASSYPSPETWAQKAAPFLLKLSAKNNGQPLTAP